MGTLSIGQVAQRAGVSVETVRFYEREGLEEPPRRASGYRQYPEQVVKRLHFIKCAQRLGFSLKEIAELLLLTLLIAGLHLRRHHQPGPFILSLVAAGSVFFAIYSDGLLPQATGGDHMAVTPTWSPYLAYGAIIVLLFAQVWDGLRSSVGVCRGPRLYPRTPLPSSQKHERKVSDAQY